MHLTEDHFCQLFLRSVDRLHPGKHVLDEVDQPEFIKEFVDPILEDEERPHWRELLIEHFAKCREKEKNPYVDILAAVQVWHMATLGCTCNRLLLRFQIYSFLVISNYKKGVL